MLSYKLSYDSKILPINKKKKYISNALTELKEKLNNTKSKLDVEFSNNWFARYWKEFDPFKREKNVIATIGNTINISNAWLKCYEILNYFNLLPAELNDEHNESQFLHFDNAAFPGSFIISTHHLIHTTKQWHAKYKWIASSLFEPNEENPDPLEDKYKLYANYTDNWLMNEENNGDVLERKNQENFYSRLHNTVDLYTSDLGFDVSNDYNNQELLQLPANIGQILTGLLTLKKGGSFVTKQYTTFEMTTVSVMFALSQLFDEFYICKPYTSRQANSETYLVGKGFKGADIDHPYVKAMFSKITSNKLDVPLFDAKQYPTKYLQDIVKISEEIFGNQIDKLNHDLEKTKECINSRYRGKTQNNPIVKEFHVVVNEQVESWYMQNKVYPILESAKLQMEDGLRQN